MKNLKLILAILVVAFAANSKMIAQSSTISILDQPVDLIGCYDEVNRVLGVVAFNENTTNELSFQWFKDGEAMVAGVHTPFETNEAGLSFGNLRFEHSGVYTCAIWDANVETIAVARYSDPVTVYVISKPNITRQPMSVMANAGETVYMDVEATLYGELPPSYQTKAQWYNGNTPLVDGVDFEGTKSSYLTVNNAEKYYNAQVWCQVEGYCGTVNSATVTITPMPGVQWDQDVMGATSVCAGTTNTFTVMASATNGGDNANIMYQWYVGSTMLTDGATISGAMTNTLVWTVASGTTSDINCVVKYGQNGQTLNSSMVSVVGNDAPMFSSTLTDMEIEEGDDLVLMATASGTDNTYNWYMESSTMSIGTGSSLTITATTADDSGLYYCVAMNDCGMDQTNSASITVKEAGIVMSVDNADKFNFNVSPNPVQNNSNVTFNLLTAQNVRLVLNNATGLEVAELANGYLPRGNASFEINANALNLTSGVYYLTLVTENGIATKKLMFIK